MTKSAESHRGKGSHTCIPNMALVNTANMQTYGAQEAPRSACPARRRRLDKADLLVQICIPQISTFGPILYCCPQCELLLFEQITRVKSKDNVTESGWFYQKIMLLERPLLYM